MRFAAVLLLALGPTASVVAQPGFALADAPGRGTSCSVHGAYVLHRRVSSPATLAVYARPVGARKEEACHATAEPVYADTLDVFVRPIGFSPPYLALAHTEGSETGEARLEVLDVSTGRRAYDGDYAHAFTDARLTPHLGDAAGTLVFARWIDRTPQPRCPAPNPDAVAFGPVEWVELDLASGALAWTGRALCTEL